MSIPTKPPTFRTLDWGALVRRIEGDDYHREDVGYRFREDRRDERRFNDPGSAGGPYKGTGA